MEKENSAVNLLMCDPETGICGIPELHIQEKVPVVLHENKIQITYYTDPICSSCWGIEPQLRKLKLEYGDIIEIDYRMGGLLPDWNYNSGGISSPADVAHHWDEVSKYYDMPIDGDIMLEDPVQSSYPPSIAFKAAQIQDKDLAVVFMRELREFLFLHKKNIGKLNIIAQVAEKVGLNVAKLKADYYASAQKLFEEDLQFVKEIGVRGFPSLLFINQQGEQEFVYGSKPYEQYEAAIQKLAPSFQKNDYDKSWQSLFQVYKSLTAKEYAVLSSTDRQESEILLNKLNQEGILEKFSTKNGSMWIRNDTKQLIN